MDRRDGAPERLFQAGSPRDSRERVALAIEHQQPDRPPGFARYISEIERRLRDALGIADECGAGGGYILASAHHIQAETSIANIAAFYEAALDARGFLHTV